MNKKKMHIAMAIGLSALLLFAGACNKDDGKSAGTVEPNNDKVSSAPMSEEQYIDMMQGYYDELMEASSLASKGMDSVSATEDDAIKAQRLKEAMVLVEQTIPIYAKFKDIEAPEKFTEAQQLINTGAEASGEVLRLTVKMSKAAEDEDKIAEVMMIQKEMESHTTDALNFSKGLEIVLGGSVGTGEDNSAISE